MQTIPSYVVMGRSMKAAPSVKCADTLCIDFITPNYEIVPVFVESDQRDFNTIKLLHEYNCHMIVEIDQYHQLVRIIQATDSR